MPSKNKYQRLNEPAGEMNKAIVTDGIEYASLRNIQKKMKQISPREEISNNI